MKQNILVSACLLGENCRYDGKNCYNDYIHKLEEKYNIIPACAEMLGGLPCPRLPSENKDGKIINTANEDVSNEFILGAKKVLEIYKNNNCIFAVLKSKSPSCGYGKIYDGTFSGNLIDGNGVTAQLLLDNNIKVYTDKEIEKLI